MTALPSTTKYKNHRFPVEIISHAVWLSFRFCLSFREVEELLLEHGVVVTYEPVMRRGLATPDEKKAIQGYTDSDSGVPEVERALSTYLHGHNLKPRLICSCLIFPSSGQSGSRELLPGNRTAGGKATEQREVEG